MANIKKYNGSTWENTTARKYETKSEAVQSGDTIYTNGQPITTYTLKGNEEHTGTPSPQNPVVPNGTGERTENLFNLNAVDTAKGYMENYRLNSGNPDTAVGNFISEYIAVIPDSTYTISGFTAGWSSSVVWYDSAFAKIGYQLYENKSINTFTVPSNAKYVRFTGDMNKKDTTMFNLGSTAKPFEPYGYKIPISSANTTTPVYLGEVETTRKIKKIVFDGTEQDWGVYNNGTERAYFYYNLSDAAALNQALCTHFKFAQVFSSNTSLGFYLTVDGQLRFRPDNVIGMSLQDWKDWLLTNQPSVWYVLATPETAAVNEPLMKISDYADTLSNATAIPTTEGANSITVDTTVQPSEFTATWAGWHNATVKEWDGSEWG